MNNILYLDDFINLYNKKNDLLIKYKPYKKTLYNGIIKDKDKFIKIYNKLLSKYKLKNHFFNENICVIVNNLYKIDDKNKLINILEELNYRKVKFINENELLNINNKNLIINYNKTYYYLTYIDSFGNINTNLYDNILINRELINVLIKKLNKKNIIIMGNNINELENILNDNYYKYEDSDNLLIKMLKNKKI